MIRLTEKQLKGIKEDCDKNIRFGSHTVSWLLEEVTALRKIAKYAEKYIDGMCWCDDPTAMNGESGLCSNCQLNRAFREWREDKVGGD